MAHETHEDEEALLEEMEALPPKVLRCLITEILQNLEVARKVFRCLELYLKVGRNREDLPQEIALHRSNKVRQSCETDISSICRVEIDLDKFWTELKPAERGILILACTENEQGDSFCGLSGPELVKGVGQNPEGELWKGGLGMLNYNVPGDTELVAIFKDPRTSKGTLGVLTNEGRNVALEILERCKKSS